MTTLHRWAGVAAALVLGSASLQAQVVLPPLNPVLLDTTALSTSGSTPAMIDFVNLEPFAVDIYWIDYGGDRVFYNTLAANTSYFQGTFITHPWVVAMAGSGDTLAQGSGNLLVGFLAETVNLSQDTAFSDIAYIGAVPEPETLVLMLAGLGMVAIGAARRRGA